MRMQLAVAGIGLGSTASGIGWAFGPAYGLIVAGLGLVTGAWLTLPVDDDASRAPDAARRTARGGGAR